MNYSIYIASYFVLGLLSTILLGFLLGWRYIPNINRRDTRKTELMLYVILFWPVFILWGLVVRWAFFTEIIFNKFQKNI